MLITSFPAVISNQAVVLILGSMPGVQSLQQKQYYAHRQNCFWSIMGQLCGAGFERSYSERLLLLQQVGIGLWGVLKYCSREESLDANIITSSEIANNLPLLLSQYNSIQVLAFNGKKAEGAFHRHITPNLTTELQQRLQLITLPSTSPANAMLSKAEKWQAWQILQAYLPKEAL